MSVDILLTRLDHVRQTGPGRWIARCPAHEDRGPSLSIRELPDGAILVHDFAGCETQAVLAAVGLAWRDLYPDRPHHEHHRKGKRRPRQDKSVLLALQHEALVVTIAAADEARGAALCDADRERLNIAKRRLRARKVAHG
jgi:hypothetical protein